MAFFIFFLAAAPAGLVPAPYHRGKHLTISIIPAALLGHKPGVFMEVAIPDLILLGLILLDLILLEPVLLGLILLGIEGRKFHKTNTVVQLGIICFHHRKSQPVRTLAGMGQHLPVIDLAAIRITGGNEVVNILVEKGGIPGSHK